MIDANCGVQILRLAEVNDDALHLLMEYYETLNIVQQDPPGKIQSMIDDPASGLWLAYVNGQAAGCVLLRSLPSMPSAGECKRLYVRPFARGQRIADRLMDALEDFARSQGLQSIYLDSHDGLQAAIALYRKRGYVTCDRYNNNPQATIFLCKRL